VAYAIIRTGGKQFRVTPGQVVRIPRVDEAEVGSSLRFEDVLVYGGDDGVRIGSPVVDGVGVAGTVVEHGRERKIIVFKFKRRKQYKRKQGHRQNYTAIRIDAIA
jgi:large subunit ribosomal protein L21